MKDKIEITYTVETRSGTRIYNESYLKDSYFCPNCGKQDCWMRENSDDYYEGPEYVCPNCEHVFTVPRMVEFSHTMWHAVRWNVFRKALNDAQV